MNNFDPEQCGFVRIDGFLLGGAVQAYELRNHAIVDGTLGKLRINIYMSKDNEYVHIWHGLVEPMFAEAVFTQLPIDISFYEQYHEMLFNGYISSNSEAEIIIKSLRFPQYGQPAVLFGAPKELRCELL